MRALRLLLVCGVFTACVDPGDVGVHTASIAEGIEITDTLEVVAIRRFSDAGEFLCSGTVIGPYHVMTARHCVADGANYETVSLPSDFEVLVGAVLVDPRTIRAHHSVARVHAYGGEREEFAYEGRDVAVLVTETRIATPIRPLSTDDPARGSTLTIVGFGRSTEIGVISSGTKRRGETIVGSVIGFDPAADARYSGIITATGGANGVCSGDSGGAAFDATGAVAGVTSLGARSCYPGGGGVFMSTLAARAFLEDALRLYPGCDVDDPRDGCTTTPVTPLGVASAPLADELGLDLAADDGNVLASDRRAVHRLVDDGAGNWTVSELWASAFGAPALAVDGERAAAAAGSEVVVWDAEPWGTPDATITIPASSAAAVAMAGDLVVVGTPYEGPGATAGEVHVLRRGASGWAFETTIVGSSASFGAAVATDGVRIAIGAPLEDGGRDSSGVVYLHASAAGTWAEEARLVASDAGPHDHFGTALAMRADVLAVGAPGEDSVGGDSGAVYVFTLGTTGATERERLLPNDGSGRLGDFGNQLGTDVALSADASRLVAGAPGDLHAGSVYVFGTRPAGGYGLTERIGGTMFHERFAARVAIDGDRVLASAPDRFDGTTGISGVVRAFSATGTCGARTMEPSPCEPPIEPDAGPPSLDAGRRDAGRPAVPDAPVAPDAGPETPPPPASGCSCTVSSTTTARTQVRGVSSLLLLALVASHRLRKR